MYLFLNTFFSQCPDEFYCKLLTIMASISLFCQIFSAIFLFKKYKRKKNEYIKFLLIVRSCHIFYNILGSYIGEFRTFLPRYTIICYGLIRYLGDIACSISGSLFLSLAIAEGFCIIYAFNGQYNIIIREVRFHENNKLQWLSIFLMIIYFFLFFITFSLGTIPREEAIKNIYMVDNELKKYINGSFTIIAFGGSKTYMFNIYLTIAFTGMINTITHYIYICGKIYKFIKNLQINKSSNIKRNYSKHFYHHIISSIFPVILIYIPTLYLSLAVIFFTHEPYIEFGRTTTNAYSFIIISYSIVSSIYIVIYFWNHSSEESHKKSSLQIKGNMLLKKFIIRNNIDGK
uniref:G-protein coupled receptors family 1 profile domain-containing protein n=1 Tax=Strongyloides stercoralis TaxID=6248 RepID=A0AAF5DEX8_STRER